MEVPFVDLKRQYKNIQSEISSAITEVFDNTAFVHGKYVENFENEFAQYIGSKYCLCVSSGTSALHLSLLAAGVGPGDEVIVPANTFIATAEAVSHCGAIPVFVDVDFNYHMNIFQAEKKITNKTKAIIPVHLYGRAMKLNELYSFVSNSRIKIIEDCAQAHGASIGQCGNWTSPVIPKKVGNFGFASAFSFYPSKNLGACGEGGAITTNDENAYVFIKQMRDHGSIKKYEHNLIGYNYRMSGLQGAVLSVKLKYLDKWNEKRRELANRYNCNFSDCPIVLPDNMSHEDIDPAFSVYHLYVIQTNKDRTMVMKYLKDKGISTGIHYPIPLHLTKAYEHLGYSKGDLPWAEMFADRIISLPMFPELQNDEVDYVCNTLKDIL